MDELSRSCPDISFIPSLVLEERGEEVVPPSPPQEGDRLEPEPVDPGEVAGPPVTTLTKVKGLIVRINIMKPA